uniref:Uncharacterized protein n=1 Tax=Anguilla anguilla TaxID=7936 RepID=A0A0E9P9U1_ANGAN
MYPGASHPHATVFFIYFILFLPF